VAGSRFQLRLRLACVQGALRAMDLERHGPAYPAQANLSLHREQRERRPAPITTDRSGISFRVGVARQGLRLIARPRGGVAGRGMNDTAPVGGADATDGGGRVPRGRRPECLVQGGFPSAKRLAGSWCSPH